MNLSHQIEADEARAEGTIVYAVGVGSVSEETLLAIAGDESNYFDIEEFTELDSELVVGFCACAYPVALRPADGRAACRRQCKNVPVGT